MVEGEEEVVLVYHLAVARILGVKDNVVLMNFLVQSSEFPNFPAPPSCAAEQPDIHGVP
jgi:hypothetical protein